MLRAVVDVFATALLALVVWGSCAGIGAWILPRPVKVGADEPASWNRMGLAACVGLGALIALGGVGTFAHLPLWLIVGPFTVVGLVLAVGGFLGKPWEPGPWPAVLIMGLTVAGFLLVALVESRIGRTLQLNTCDELRAYVPMVHRLLDTNAIVEPWSYRRLQNIGGFTYLQAVPVSIFGDVGIAFAETVLASVFLAGFFVSTGFRSMWARVVALLSILAIPALWIPRISAAPVLAVIPLLLACFAITAELRVVLRQGDRGRAARYAVAAGLLIAGVASVRTPILPVAALTIALGILTVGASPARERLRSLGIAVAASLAAILCWLLASWESVGTPLYPLIPGNANTAVPSERDPDALKSLSAAVTHTMKYLNGGTYFWVTVAVLVIALVARRLLPDGALIVIIAAVTVVCIVLFTVSLSMASVRDFGRYIAPMGASLVVFLFYETVRAMDASGVSAGRRPAIAGLLAIGVAFVCAVAVFTPVAIDTPKYNLNPAGLDLLRWSPTRVPGALYADRLTPARAKQNMRRAVTRVDPKHTALAVDRPYLVNTKKYDFPNLDLPGWATPTGTFPFFTGARAKVVALRKAGFVDLIATVPAADVCLTPSVRRYQEEHGTPPDSIYAKYFLDWTDTISQIQKVAPGAVTQVGQLLVIDLPRAEAALAPSGSH